MIRRPFLERPADHLGAQRQQHDAVRYACPVQQFRDPPMHLHDRIVCWGCLAATVALIAIMLIWR